jgi:hypothetical protein
VDLTWARPRPMEFKALTRLWQRKVPSQGEFDAPESDRTPSSMNLFVCSTAQREREAQALAAEALDEALVEHRRNQLVMGRTSGSGVERGHPGYHRRWLRHYRWATPGASGSYCYGLASLLILSLSQPRPGGKAADDWDDKSI